MSFPGDRFLLVYLCEESTIAIFSVSGRHVEPYGTLS